MLRYESSRGAVLLWRQSTETAAPAGTAKPRRRFYVVSRGTHAVTFNVLPEANAITGTLARTNANDTSAASGTTTIVGTLARTNANDTSAASGEVGSGSTGTVAYTNANDTSAASGTTTIVGTLATTNANDSVSASGWAGTITGTLATTNANDGVSAAGSGGLVVNTGAGSNKRRRRERYVVKHGDRYEVFSTPEEMEAYVEAAQAVEAPRPKKQRKPIRIELTPEFAAEVSEVATPPRFSPSAPTSVALDQVRRLEKRLAEIERQRQEEEEDDEVLLWLM